MRLHREHGLNPTLSTCIICGKETGEIALLGAAYKGEAPMHMVTGLEPCDKCKEDYLKEGVLLLETDENRVPTGSLVVIKVEAFSKVCNKVPIPPRHIALVEQGMFEQLGLKGLKNE